MTATPLIPPAGRRDVRPPPLVGTPLYQLNARAMGRRVHLTMVGSDPSALEEAHEGLIRLEQMWDPDRHGSDLRRLATHAGTAIPVAPDTVLLAALAYGDGSGSNANHHGSSGSTVKDGAVIDSRHCRVGLPVDATAELADLAPALAVDLLVADLIDAGVAGLSVRVGETVRVAGSSPYRSGWVVDSGASSPARNVRLRLRDGAVATRTRRHGGVLASAVVVAAHAWEAATLANRALQMGTDKAIDLLLRAGASGLLDAGSGAAAVGDWPSYLAHPIRASSRS